MPTLDIKGGNDREMARAVLQTICYCPRSEAMIRPLRLRIAGRPIVKRREQRTNLAPFEWICHFGLSTSKKLPQRASEKIPKNARGIANKFKEVRFQFPVVGTVSVGPRSGVSTGGPMRERMMVGFSRPFRSRDSDV
jgi:hypothetical protein